MSRIVIDARELRTSSGRYVERLLHYLQKIDRQNDYQILLKPQDMQGWKLRNPNFTPVACTYKEFTFGEQIGLLRQINSLKPDLVHFTFPQQPTLYKGKTVTTIHDLTTLRFDNPDKNTAVFRIKQKVYAQVMKRAGHRSVQLLTGSEFVKQDFADFAGVSPDKINVTPESADPIKEKSDPLPALMSRRFIMYIGRPTPHKNLERLIEAFVRLKSRHPDLVLVLAGKKDANYERIAAEVRHRTIKNVVFTDFVSEGRLRWLYENCQAYVFPSLSEGFGLPGLEAMQHGAPVVSSNATCLPEIYGKAAHYFDPYDIQAMTEAIDEVLSDQKLRKQLVKKGAEQVKKYSWQRMAKQTLEVYKKALKA